MLNKSYMRFYLDGREAKLMDDDIDQVGLGKKVMEGGDDPRAVALQAAIDVALPHRTGRGKTRWIRENEDDIKTAGGDSEEAHRHYLQGRIDSLAYALENDIIEELIEDADVDDGDDEPEAA